MKDEKTKFVSLYSQFYEKFFSGTADAVELLADLQRDYSEEYNLIKNFNKDVDAMEEFIDNLPEDKQAILLKIFLKANKFGKDMVNLFDSTEQEKRDLATNLKKFASELKNEFEKDIRLAGLFSSNISDIKIACSKESLIIKSKNSDKGEIETIIPAVLKNDPFEISVNYHYLLDGLKIIDSEKVLLEFTGNGNPVIVKPNDNKELTYLIMPLRS